MNTLFAQAINFGLSTKKDGSMKGRFAAQASYLQGLTKEKKIIVSANLVHGAKLVRVDDILSDQIIPNCDALITSDVNKILCLTVADCLPIYFYDQKQAVIALAHAGWRGVLSEIVKEVIASFKNHYDSKPEDILVIIGPHIKGCHFEVQMDVASKFPPEAIIRRDNKIYIDLAHVVQKQLIEAGILTNNITISHDCTYCQSDKYFSYRRDKPKELETMLAYISFK